MTPLDAAPWHVQQAKVYDALAVESCKETEGLAPVAHSLEDHRRSVLTAALKIVAAGIASVAFRQGALAQALDSIEAFAKTPTSKVLASPEIRPSNIFGLRSSNFALHPGHIHYKNLGFPHHDDLSNLSAIANDFLSADTNFAPIAGVDLLRAGTLNTDVIVSGSPVSNMLSRIALGYQRISEDGSEGLRRDGVQFFDLPFEFVFDAAYLRKQGITTVSRQLGNLLHTVPNWSIRDISKDRMLIPEARDADDWSRDFLLVTVLPNIFSLDVEKHGTKLVLFMGTHGVGTRAAYLLYADSTLRTLVSDFSKKEPFFQTLIPVNNIMHADGSLLPIGVDIANVEFRPIRVLEADYRLALDILRQEQGRSIVQGFGFPAVATLVANLEQTIKNYQTTDNLRVEVDGSAGLGNLEMGVFSTQSGASPDASMGAESRSSMEKSMSLEEEFEALSEFITDTKNKVALTFKSRDALAFVVRSMSEQLGRFDYELADPFTIVVSRGNLLQISQTAGDASLTFSTSEVSSFAELSDEERQELSQWRFQRLFKHPSAAEAQRILESRRTLKV